jgi:hypothetical protein
VALAAGGGLLAAGAALGLGLGWAAGVEAGVVAGACCQRTAPAALVRRSTLAATSTLYVPLAAEVAVFHTTA